jgi:hypothetical protein
MAASKGSSTLVDHIVFKGGSIIINIRTVSNLYRRSIGPSLLIQYTMDGTVKCINELLKITQIYKGAALFPGTLFLTNNYRNNYLSKTSGIIASGLVFY